VYAEFLRRRDANEELDFEEFCQEHPDVATALRLLHSLAGNIQTIPDGASFLRALHGRFATREATDIDDAKPGEHAARPGGSFRSISLDDRKDRYSVEREIARGGMGKILRVWDGDLRRALAMKVLLRQRPDDREADAVPAQRKLFERFLEEAQITAQLDHPGIVPIHDLGLDSEGRVFFTMQLVQGSDLSSIFELAASERQGWTRTRALGSLVKVCEAVAFAHSKGVIHRDLKPANVMVGRFGETFVMDWGLAKIFAGPAAGSSMSDDEPLEGAVSTADSSVRTMHGTVVGTPAYMPPEQAGGRIDDLDARTDVYAIGAMLYELLSGRPPYTDSVGTSPREMIEAIRSGPPTRLTSLAPSVPAELVAICEKAMSYDNKARYRSAVEMAADLQAFLDHRVVKAYRTGALVELRKWVSRNRTTAVAIASAVLFAVVGLVSVVFFQARSRREMELSTDVYVQSGLARRAETELWPATPENTEVMEGWLREARSLVTRLDIHRARLDDVRKSSIQGTRGEQSSWHFEDPDDQRRHARLVDLVAGLESFVRSDSSGRGAGLIAEVEKRLEFARTVRTRTVDDRRELWTRVIGEIADPARSPAYRGLRLRPQVGLVPLGRDPDSGLHEFAHLQTGEIPKRGADGRLRIDEESGLVFVLLPGGEFTMGSRKPTEELPDGNPNVDAHRRWNEGPPRAIVLAPFLLSKFEMTQGQWWRFTGENPSTYGPKTKPAEKPRSLLNPVEHIDWHRSKEVMLRLGLVLPTEAQWEYAARGGTSTPWWTGEQMESLIDGANLADRDLKQRHGIAHAMEWLDDGHIVHRSVGGYRANSFGLHDVAGNVWEWCRDRYHQKPSMFATAAEDGESLGGSERLRVNRGGSFYSAASEARSAFRGYRDPFDSANDLGVRPARGISK